MFYREPRGRTRRSGLRNAPCLPAPLLPCDSPLLLVLAGVVVCLQSRRRLDRNRHASSGAAAVLGDPAEPAHTVVHGTARPARVVRARPSAPCWQSPGVLLQALFRNPLADSYVLGVSGGSSLGALLALLVGGSLWLVQASAAAGAVLATLLVLALARGGGTVRVLLTGVVHRQRLRRTGDAGAGPRRQRPAARHDVLAGRGSGLGCATLDHGRRPPC